MERINLLKSFAFLENVMCIYRNFMFYNQRARFIIIGRIVAELVFYIFSAYNGFLLVYTDWFSQNFSVFFIEIISKSSFYVITFFTMVNGILKSREYKTFIFSINKIHDYILNDTDYLKRLKCTNIFCTATIIILFVVTLIRTAIDGSNYGQLSGINARSVIWMLTTILLECQYQTECVVYFGFILFIHAIMKYLNIRVTNTIIKIARSDMAVKRIPKYIIGRTELKDETDTGVDVNNVVDLEEVRYWVFIYRQLGLTTELLQKCFGMQVRYYLLAFNFFFAFFQFSYQSIFLIQLSFQTAFIFVTAVLNQIITVFRVIAVFIYVSYGNFCFV